MESAFARTVYIGGRGDVLMASATTITELKTSLTTKRIPASHREGRGPIGKTIKRIGAGAAYVTQHFTASIIFSIKAAPFTLVLIATYRCFRTGVFVAHTALIPIAKNAIKNSRKG